MNISRQRAGIFFAVLILASFFAVKATINFPSKSESFIDLSESQPIDNFPIFFEVQELNEIERKVIAYFEDTSYREIFQVKGGDNYWCNLSVDYINSVSGEIVITESGFYKSSCRDPIYHIYDYGTGKIRDIDEDEYLKYTKRFSDYDVISVSEYGKDNSIHKYEFRKNGSKEVHFSVRKNGREIVRKSDSELLVYEKDSKLLRLFNIDSKSESDLFFIPESGVEGISYNEEVNQLIVNFDNKTQIYSVDTGDLLWDLDLDFGKWLTSNQIYRPKRASTTIETINLQNLEKSFLGQDVFGEIYNEYIISNWIDR